MTANQKIFSAMAASAVAVVALFSAPTIGRANTTNLNAGDTINLRTLINNGLSVQIGDKVFGDFSWVPSAADPDMAASNVNVKALVNLNNIGFRLEFQTAWSASDFEDIFFDYTAAVTNSSNLISDLHLSITGTVSGQEAYASVGEDAYTGGLGVGHVGHVEASLFDGYPEYAASSSNLDYAVTKLWIGKDMFIQGAPDNSISISAIDQIFSQIPEPSTALLVGLGLLGVVAANRKRRS